LDWEFTRVLCWRLRFVKVLLALVQAFGEVIVLVPLCHGFPQCSYLLSLSWRRWGLLGRHIELGIGLGLLAKLENDYLGLLLVCRASRYGVVLLTFIELQNMMCTIGLLLALGVGLLLDLWLLLRLPL
jgi:hypothetical protein